MGHHDEERGLFDRLLKVYGKAVGWFVRLRWLIVPIYLGACGLVLWVLGLQVGTELFPQIDSGEFVLRFRPPPGSNFELTRQMAVKCLEEIEREAKPENIEITMGYVGQVAPNFGIDNMVLFMRGPDDGQLRVALREDSGIKLDEFRERLRKVLPERVIPWLAKRLEQGGLSQAEAQRQAKMSTFGFEPGDIVTKVMSFGSSTPIAVRIVGTDLKMVRQHAEKIAAEMKRIPFLRDVQFEQKLDYPTVEVDIDREKAGLERRQGRGRGSCARHGDGVDPLRHPQLLDRREDRLRLPGPASDPAAPDGEAGRRRDLAARVGQPPGQPDDPRRGDGPQGRAARRDRPRHVAALPDPDRERRGRGHGPGLAPGRPGDRRRRGAAPRRAGGDHGPASADDRDVRGAGHRAWRSPCS